MTGCSPHTFLVEGILLYYPTLAGCSSLPDVSAVQVDDDMCIPEEERPASASICSLYWQDRLVPEAELKALPFLPDARTEGQCRNMKLPVRWRDRLRGCMFFNWEFRHISNNKLKFQVDPNINEWINDKKRFRDEAKCKPLDIQKKFLEYESTVLYF